MRYFSMLSVKIFLFIVIILNPVVCLDSQELGTLESIWSQLKLDNQNLNACAWEGVTCRDSHITKISLPGLYLQGSIPQAICQLPYLEELVLARNSFSGTLNLSGCLNLTSLDLSSNYLSGDLSSLSHFQKLGVLDLSSNRFEGEFLEQIVNITNLRSLNLSHNSFRATNLRSLNLSHNSFRATNIKSVWNLTGLEVIVLSDNLLFGELPARIIDGLVGLRYLDLSQNNLSGPIPDFFLPSLTGLQISGNKFSGPIPSAPFTRLKNFQALIANENELSGTIPEELGSIPTLRSLHLSNNKLVGNIPEQLFGNTQLESIDLSYNYLEGTIPESIYNCKHVKRIVVSNNRLSGNISSKIGNLSALKQFNADANFLHGNIPKEMGNCKNLAYLNLARNRISGQIPTELGSLGVLQLLYLEHNYISGKIPRSLSNCKKLAYLDLSSNQLSGTIPDILFLERQNLQSVLLQNNSISGSIPSSIGNLKLLLDLNLAYNNLGGEIPKEIGMCANLQIGLNLSHNSLEGSIPVSLSELTRLERLDLSENTLTGEIPGSLDQMRSLEKFDVSYNQRLTGTLPHFSEATVIDINETSVSVSYEEAPFSASNHNTHKNKAKIIAVAVTGSAVALVVIGLTLVAYKYKYFKHEYETAEEQESSLIQGHLMDPQSIHRKNIDFQKALKATQNPANVILKNSLNTYYKAVMPSGTAYTVKELNWVADENLEGGNNKKLVTELEKQGKLSHPNIMMPLAYALKKDLVLIFYEHVHKGCLREFLTEFSLAWPCRQKIAIGVAQGLAYLHGCHPPLIHLDLNTENILLKSPAEPQIGDIDLCMIADHPTRTSSGILSTIAGSIGYIPPDYAYTLRVTMASNVYSFGVVLLELLTGRPPIVDDTVLAQWVQWTPSRDETWEQILDPKISNSSFQVRNSMMSVLRIALACINSSPDARPKIETVVRMLQVTEVA